MRVIELSNIEISEKEYCLLDKIDGQVIYYKDKKKVPIFTGLYSKCEQSFVAFYPDVDIPKMYYEGKEYPVLPTLSMEFDKTNPDDQICYIKDYGLEIHYKMSHNIGYNCYETEEELDIFLHIKSTCKKERLYKDYLKDLSDKYLAAGLSVD